MNTTNLDKELLHQFALCKEMDFSKQNLTQIPQTSFLHLKSFHRVSRIKNNPGTNISNNASSGFTNQQKLKKSTHEEQSIQNLLKRHSIYKNKSSTICKI